MSNQLRILILEDIPSDAKLMEHALHSGGIEFTSRNVYTREAFLKQLEDFSPDIILSDYTMPQFNGMEALELVKEHCPSIPLIIVTGSMNEEVAVECIKAGAEDYVTREHLVRLCSAIKGALEKKRVGEEKRRAEEALRKSEAKYQDLYSRAPVAYFSIGTDGLVEGANKAAEELTGYSLGELLGMKVVDLHAKESKAKAIELFERFRRGGPLENEEATYERKDGQKIHGLLSVSPIKDENDRVLENRCVIVDITGRKRTEEALREEHSFRSAVIKRAAEGLCVCHDTAEYPYVEFLVWNDRMSDITGYTMEEINRLGWYQTIYPDLEIQARAMDRMERMRQGEDLHAEEWEITRADGEKRVLSISTSVLEAGDGVVHVLALMDDVTDRKLTEEALRKNEATLRGIFRAAPIGIGLVSNRILGWTNEQLFKMTGYSSEELKGKGARILYPSDEEFERVGQEKYDQIRERGMGAVETYWKCKDGRIINVLLSSAPLDPSDLSAGVIFTALDITDRKRGEEDRESLIKELESKNAELESFTYTVSHDLKSPIITIKGFLGMLEKDAAKGDMDRMKVDIRRISDAADKMKDLLGELLELSRIGRLVNPPEEVPLRDLAHEAIESLAGRLSEGKVHVEIAPDLALIYCDANRILQVLENLMGNAIKFMAEQSNPLIEVGMRQGDKERVFYVRDNGMGIDPKYHEKVFGLFDKLDAKSEGTGVGLAIVKRIIGVHGGRIWVESDGAGTGSTFCFTIPEKKESKI